MSVGVAFPSLILIVIHLMIYEKVRLESVRKSIRKLKVDLSQKRLSKSKQLRYVFKFSAQDSDLEYLFRRSKNSPVSSDLKPPLLKMGPNFDLEVSIHPNPRNIFMAIFIDLW